MTAACVLLAAALLLLRPAPRGERRLRRLVAAGRLAATPARPRPRYRAPRPSVPLVIAGSLAAGGIVAVVWAPAMGIAAALGLGAAGRAAVRALDRRSQAGRLGAVTAGVQLLRSELEAGATPAVALAAAGAALPAFAALPALATAAGSDDVAGALLDDPLLAPVGHAWRLATVTGAPLAGVLARVDADLAARAEQARQVTAALAGPRSSALLLAALPLLGVLLGTALGARPLTLLAGTGLGHLLVCAGVALEVAGLAWTARLAGAAERA